MRSRRPSQEHSDAVARRLAELSAQLAASRETPAGSVPAHEEEWGLDHAVGEAWWSDHTRIAQRPALTVVPPVDDDPVGLPAGLPVGQPEPPLLPVPGRHAARRPPAWVPDLVPESLRGTVRLGGPQLTAVAVLVALGLAVTCWWVVRGDPSEPVPIAVQQAAGTAPGAPITPLGGDDVATAETPSGPAAPPAGPGGAGGAAGAGPVTVDVAGRVRRPGIVVLDAGARVVDALESAGGARPGVDLTSINLARLLVDGEQIVVGVPALPVTPGSPAAPGSTGSAPPPGGATTTLPELVDLNLADQPLLETLPQVGPVTAAAIIAWRAEHGGFTAVTELLEVDGIGDATLAELTPYVTV